MYEIFIKLLNERGLSTYKLSKELNIGQSTFSDWKAGRSVPKMDKLVKIANYFGVSVDYLLTGNETNAGDNDISIKLNELLDMLENDSSVLNGKELDSASRELLKASLENVLLTSKIISNNK